MSWNTEKYKKPKDLVLSFKKVKRHFKKFRELTGKLDEKRPNPSQVIEQRNKRIPEVQGKLRLFQSSPKKTPIVVERPK